MRTVLLLAILFAAAATTHADDTIRQVQKKLVTMGYYEGAVDGEFGSQTAAAIRRFQLAENLRVTGEPNDQTLQRLGIAASSQQERGTSRRPAPTPVPEYVAIAAIFKGGPFISVGPEMQIATIRQAKKSLRLLGYYSGEIDGSPDAGLVAALKAWQKSAGFRQTGRFDENTLRGLDIIPD